MKKLVAMILSVALLVAVPNAYAWKCPQCNNEMNGKFCTECGTKQPENVCASCGTNFGTTSPKFCFECGEKQEVLNTLSVNERTVSAKGLLSDVTVTVTQNQDGTIAAIVVDATGETHGIGTQCMKDDFLSQFIGKVGPFNDVDAVAGATFTSNAVITAVNTLFPMEESSIAEVATILKTEYIHFSFTCADGMNAYNSICQALVADGTLSHLYSVEESFASEVGNIYMIKKDGVFIDSALSFDKSENTGSIECINVSYSDMSKAVSDADKANMVMIAMMLADDTLTFSDADTLGIAVMTAPNYQVTQNGYEYSYDGDHIWEIRKIAPTDIHATSSQTANQVRFSFINHNEFSQYWHNGVYRCGTDCQPGDYYIMSLYGAGALYDVTNTPDSFSWSQHRVFRKVHIEAGQYIKVSHDAIMIPVSEINETEWEKNGVYWVGKDISAGDYKVESLTDEYHTDLRHSTGIRGAYQICYAFPDSFPLSCSPLWNKQTYITLSDGQCIIINNAQLTLIE